MLSVVKKLIFTLLLASIVQADLETCKSDLIQWLKAFYTPGSSDYNDMVLYSGHGLNDLGLYFQCESVSHANYVIFEISVSPALVFGLCLPSSCSEDDYWTLLSSNITGLSSHLSQYTADLKLHPELKLHSSRNLADTSIPIERISFPKNHIYGINDFTTSAGFMLAFCVLLLLVSLIGTILDLNNAATDELRSSMASSFAADSTVMGDKSIPALKLERHKLAPLWAQVFMCFSVTSNASRLFSTKEEKKKDPLDVLNAMRVLSIGWVVLGHMNLYRANYSVILNYQDIIPMFSHFYTTIIYNATYAVDTFFWISGFLQGYLMTLQVASHKSINWFMIVLHRFIRILPVYMFVILLSWSLVKYAGNGPKWYNADDLMHKGCSEYFWTYPLFINNFVMPKGNTHCFSVAWYLPNDMQFYILSLPIMYLYVKQSRIFGWGLLGTITAFSMVAGGSIYYNEHFAVNYVDTHNVHFMNDYYYKPYTRITPYAVGLLAGFIYHAYKKGKTGEEFDWLAGAIADRINKSQVVRFVLYVFGLFFINFFIFCQYDTYQPNHNWSNSTNAAFAAFNKIGFSLGLTFILLPMTMGHLSFIRPFFMSNWWAAMSKLVFGVYLLHMVIGQIFIYSQPVSYFWNEVTMVKDSIFVLALTFLFAIPIHLLVESPTVSLEKIIFRR